MRELIRTGRIDLLATEILGYKLEPFHIKILRFEYYLWKNKKEGMILAPRGFGKSTIGTVTFAVFLILWNPNIRILITSSTASKAEAFLREIKTHFEQNQRIKDLFGDQYNKEAWKNAEIFVRDRTRIAKEGTLSAHGWSGAVVSKHYDVHLADDIVNEDNARTKGQREKLKDWFYMSLDPTLEPDGLRVNIGTRYHPDDLYGHFLEQNKTMANEDEETRKGKEKMEVLILKAIQDDGTSLWEDKFPVVKLHDKKRKMGSVRFGAQFQNETELMKGKIFKDEWIQYYNRGDIVVPELKIFMGVDLAAGSKEENDFFALITKGYDERGRGYTLDVVHGRYTFRQQMMIILWKAGKTIPEIKELLGIPLLAVEDMMKCFKGQPKDTRRQYRNVMRVGIESIAYQKVLPDTLIELTTDIPFIRINQTLDKTTRMQMYSARFENNMEYLPADNSCDKLKDEMLLFPESEHDDLLDAHEICNRVAGMVLNVEGGGAVEARVFK